MQRIVLRLSINRRMMNLKGISLAMNAVVLIILAAIVLLAFIYFVSGSKDQVDMINYESALRSCCGDRSRYDCSTDLKDVKCKVSWSDDPVTLEKLAIGAGLDPSNDGINGFCFCS